MSALNNFNFPSFQDLLASSVSREGGVTPTNRGPSFVEQLVTFGRTMGYMRANRYCVLLENPPASAGMFPYDMTFASRLSLNCLQAQIPDVGFASTEQFIAGPKRVIPQAFSYGDNNAQFQFNCGVDLYEYLFFRNWQRSIVDPIYNYASYYNDYAKNCSLTVILLPNNVRNFEDMLTKLNNNQLYGVRLDEVYPRTVGINAVQNASTNIVLVSNITFGYRKLTPYRDFGDELKYALHAAWDSTMNLADNTRHVDESALKDGIKKEYTKAEIQELKEKYLATDPLRAKRKPGPFDFLNPELPSKDPSITPPELDANPFINNILTSGINIAALFQGI
jgi:hypothetical protein